MFQLPEIQHDLSGFQALTNLWAQTKDCLFEEIEIHLDETSWFDADMCAAFGAVLHRLSNLNTVRLTGIRAHVEGILSKNGFLSHYGRQQIPDRWGTTIPYKRFDVKDDRYFADYIEHELIHRTECIQIVSDAGYWRREGKRTVMSLLLHPFPGTVVTIEINTADTNSYALSSELNAADIF
jgi:hypothetical protein